MASEIPIRNIYYLLCYSWNRLNEGALVDVSGIDSSELIDLFATVLISGTNHLIRRGLHQGYIIHKQDLSTIRGRIDVAHSTCRLLTKHGKAHCIYDELSVNTLPNQIIKSTLRILAGAPRLDLELRGKIHRLIRNLHGIADVPLNKFQFRKIQLHSNNRFYKFLLNICEMVQASWLVDEKTGQYKFRDFIRDDKAMARLFESFILNFYKLHFDDYDVRKERIQWVAQSGTDPGLKYLPGMETDISIRNIERTLIIDAKYYSTTLQTYYDKESIHSSNLYQLFAYLKNLEARGGNDAKATGMLLYPVVNKKLREKYEISGHEINICTLDLSRDWTEIRDELLELANGV